MQGWVELGAVPLGKSRTIARQVPPSKAEKVQAKRRARKKTLLTEATAETGRRAGAPGIQVFSGQGQQSPLRFPLARPVLKRSGTSTGCLSAL